MEHRGHSRRVVFVSEGEISHYSIQPVYLGWSISGPSRPAQQATPEQVETLRRLLSSYRAGGAAASAVPPGEEGPENVATVY
jgi:hypothetical protein